ncbi:MAG TPA: beta-ribofuranosylaminobenzene 5'-phosphate synthase family protein [Gemmatimonadales bacterium]|nr:beta-ribofuranosylaminobenzene 5'-phosphate synthase family protein [Gemmatimonadales bacterium]
MSDRDSVFVEAPSRLHFGVLDLRGRLGRCFGGLGAAIPSPSLLLEARPSPRLSAEGPDAERALEFATRFLAFHRLSGGVHLVLHRTIPDHAGLGSGTQLGLAVARAIAELRGLPTDPVELARATGRGRRSAIGTWAFGLGGFIVEGGRQPGSERVAPLLARFAIPESWRYVVAVPSGGRGLSGDAEARAFEQLPSPPDREVERVSHLVLMQLLPALVEADLPSFGGALSEIQRVTGAWFAAQQGGVFAPGPTARLVADLAGWGAAGVGQSSWGPAAYGLVDNEAQAENLAERARRALGSTGQVFAGGFAAQGARVWAGPAGSGTD